MNRALCAVGMAKKAGCLCVGTDSVVDKIREGKELLVLYASDASENTLKRLKDKSATYGAKIEKAPFTREEMGFALGKPSCACVAICDNNFIKMYRQAIIKTAEDK